MEPDTPTSQVESVPLVMVHGFGAGLLQFYKNLDHLHGNRRLLAFDLPGFGRSSRMKFPRDPVGAESQFVDVMEEWREGMGVSGGGRGEGAREGGWEKMGEGGRGWGEWEGGGGEIEEGVSRREGGQSSQLSLISSEFHSFPAISHSLFSNSLIFCSAT